MNLFLVALAFVFVSVLPFCFSLPLFFFLFLYLWIRIHKKRYLLLFSILAATHFLQVMPSSTEIGEYTIYEMHVSYALAKNERSRIVVYDIEELSYYDRIQVEDIEPIASLNNLYLFSFEQKMNQQNITHQAKSYQRIAHSNSFRSKLFAYFKNRGDPFLFSALYGIYEEETFLTSLGLPILTWLQMLSAFLKKQRKEYTVFLPLLLGLLYSVFFFFPPVLVRWVLAGLGRICFSDWKKSNGFVLIGYILIFPYGGLDLCFLFPLLFVLLQKKEQEKWRTIVLIGIQSIYFGKVNPFSLFCFSWLKKLYAVVFMIGWIHPIEPFDLPFFSFSIQTHSSSFAAVLLISLLLFILRHKKRAALFCSFGLIFYLLFAFRLSPFFHIYVLNIGQGDCTLVVEPFQKSVVMIDAGQNLYRDTVEEIIYPFLEAIHINKIDLLILTHDDFDHSGGAEALAQKVEIKTIMQNRSEPIAMDYPIYSLLIDREAKDENDESIVTFIEYDGRSYLWMGDASTDIEKELIEHYDLERIDVLKLGHHGSITSSSLAFLEELEPQLALISVGKNNRYNHPHPEVLARLEELHIDALSTSTEGMIHIFSFHDFCFFETSRGSLGRIERD